MNEKRKLFVTYCTGRKTDEKENIPAIQRYKSERIRWVYAEALKEKADFAILSGIFGLIPPERKIPKYDYCLQKDDTDRVKETNKKYIKDNMGKNEIEIVYFTKSPLLDKESVNYYDSLKKAIDALKDEDKKIAFSIRLLKIYEAFSIDEGEFKELIDKANEGYP